ncbi:BON domain-containing protein [Cnuella takakiae]|uniref:BON domain-containing protein n=1 Tax=Cnuella takakiae TaxID=1302690 RepID=A0A1M5DTL6_9BACT|nr:BON domain-containing protein [Cnuella takakiae]OLY93872.1 hypothetical protein BUE76_19800 [Cnuella takakiae]SHF70266.1 BON domain-containing protein [Cnuella takakiae]
MDNNRQNRDQYGQQSGWGQQGRQQEQWREGGDMDTNYNMQQGNTPHPGYGEVYHGNLKQREEETNRARGHNYGRQGGYQGGMFQGNQRSGNDYNPGGYGQVGNTGGGFGAWDSQGSSGSDMGRSYEDYGNRQGYGQQGNYGYSSGMNQGNYGRSGYQGSGQHMGGSDRYNQSNRQDNDDNNWWGRAKNEVRSWFNDDDNDRNEYGNRRSVGGNRSSDYRSQGEHFGKGPRGYQRSEDRIREDVCERLAYDGHVDASDIDVKVEGNEVVLTGTVRNRSEKRRAEDLVESIMGVHNVENRIRVVQEQGSGSWSNAGARSSDDSGRSYGDSNRSYTDTSRTTAGDTSRSTDSDRYSSTSGSTKGSTSGAGLENRSYTGNTGDQSGIGTESGTTNEIIRNSGNKDSNL